MIFGVKTTTLMSFTETLASDHSNLELSEERKTPVDRVDLPSTSYLSAPPVLRTVHKDLSGVQEIFFYDGKPCAF